jgi:CRISPR-associated protein Cas6/Cse3/CasE subtype I-E
MATDYRRASDFLASLLDTHTIDEMAKRLRPRSHGQPAHIPGGAIISQESVERRWRVLANPTVTREGKRYGLTREEEQLAWIARQGERNGFSVLGCERGADERLQVRQGRGGNRITLHTALFEGVLQTDSVELLRQGILNGFGHGKALGLGLLSLARIQ